MPFYREVSAIFERRLDQLITVFLGFGSVIWPVDLELGEDDRVKAVFRNARPADAERYNSIRVDGRNSTLVFGTMGFKTRNTSASGTVSFDRARAMTPEEDIWIRLVLSECTVPDSKKPTPNLPSALESHLVTMESALADLRKLAIEHKCQKTKVPTGLLGTSDSATVSDLEATTTSILIQELKQELEDQRETMINWIVSEANDRIRFVFPDDSTKDRKALSLTSSHTLLQPYESLIRLIKKTNATNTAQELNPELGLVIPIESFKRATFRSMLHFLYT